MRGRDWLGASFRSFFRANVLNVKTVYVLPLKPRAPLSVHKSSYVRFKTKTFWFSRPTTHLLFGILVLSFLLLFRSNSMT